MLTRSEIKFWETDPLSLLTDSLVATRFCILFRTVKLKSFQRWSRRGNQAKQQLQARAKRQKRRQRASKGDKGTQAWQTRRRWQIWAGTDCLRRRNRDSQRYLKAKTVWGSKAMGRGTTRHGAAGQHDLCSIVYIWAPNWSKTQLKHIFYELNVLPISKLTNHHLNATTATTFLKFVCQPKSRKSIQLPRLSSLGV